MIAPSVALSERALRIIALIGNIIEPVKMKIKIKTVNAIQPSANGSLLAIPSCESVKSAAEPPINVPVGLSRARISWITRSEATLRDAIEEMTCTRIS